LAEQKKKVTIIEMLDQILPEMEVASSSLAFFERLNRQTVRVMTKTKLVEITDNGIVVTNSEGKRIEVSGDTVVLALGLRSDQKLYDEIASFPGMDVYTVGDYREPRKIYQALHEGHLAARNL